MNTTVPIRDLYALREAMGLTQAQAARACGLHLCTYVRLETGRANPTPQTLKRLCKGLHTSPMRLRAGEEKSHA